MAVEAPVSGSARLWSDLVAVTHQLHQFLRKIHLLGGRFCLGDRYVSTAVEMVALLAVPLLLRVRMLGATPALARWMWRVGVAFVIVSFVVQVASLAFWLPLEIYQMETLGHPTFVIALRFKNIAAFALGRMDTWD